MTEWRTLGRDEFAVWHEAYKAAQGYPIPGRNAATGELVEAPIGVTTNYTTAAVLGSFDERFVVMMDPDDPDLPGDPANDPSWFFDASLTQLWVDADKWALVDAESQEAFQSYPDPETCLGPPRDVVLDDIDYVVWAAADITEDQLVALGVIIPA